MHKTHFQITETLVTFIYNTLQKRESIIQYIQNTLGHLTPVTHIPSYMTNPNSEQCHQNPGNHSSLLVYPGSITVNHLQHLSSSCPQDTLGIFLAIPSRTCRTYRFCSPNIR